MFHRSRRHLRWRGLETTPRQPDPRGRHGRFRSLTGFSALRNLQLGGGRPILPANWRPLESVSTPPRLRDLNYIFFYKEPKVPGSGFGTGLANLVAALKTDFDWLREHTRYLQRA